ncbi:dihydrolipoyl dehydrogenase [Thioalkalivibrio denitrificans]|uniref:Dihydrolipoyl dehydrogenase n=1 Tax=Thioalkalivibrio denitrificans TaxID=108003 RepID=A0A1V3NAR3_9GAMM|nr:dihydrolipoyl dehydrogenase [Thioalkalivibrio denitrificans]OOG21978.1 dihydrolipoyl dehydrogenase [Thioalkalivibrio denitrificans]
MEKQVDVAIIGAGSAGLFALGQVRKATDSYVLIDGGELGTTCARVGCMPSKAVIQVAEDFHRRTLFGRMGIEGDDALSLNAADAMEHVRDLRDVFVDKVLTNSTDNMGEEFIEGRARFISPTELQVGEDRIRARAVVIATGSRPVVPEPWRAFGDRIITTDDLFELESLPASMAVIGLGTIGLEMGQAMARMGVDVTGIDQLDHIAGLQDPEVQKVAVEIIGKEFPLWLGAGAELTEDNGSLRVSAGGQSVQVERVLAAMGRRPNVEDLDLENLGIELDERGLPPYDPATMQVGNLPVFIAGDVTGELAILHEAAIEGRIAGFNAARREPEGFARQTPLAINYCDPNIAVVGRAWNELDAERTAVGEVKLGPLGRALIMGRNKGMMRVYADREDGRLLGASLIAPRGEHIAHQLAWSIQQGLTVFDLLRMPFYHPSIEEGLQSALYDLAGKIERQPDLPVELRRA